MSDRSTGPETAAPVSRLRILATVFGTLLVVTAEFVLLTGVYERAVPVSRAEVVVAAVDGQLQSAGTGQATTLARQASTAARQAGRAGASGEAVQQAAQAVLDHPNQATLTALGRATHALLHTLDRRRTTLDLQAKALYASMLVLASFGWMIWFRRLVSRHRGLQRQLTEQQAHAVGEQRLAALIRNAADVVVVCEADSTVSFITPSARSVLGHDGDVLIGTKLTELVHPADLDLCLHLLGAVGAGEEERFSLRLLHADRRVMFVEGTLSNLLGDAAVSGLVLTVRDVSERRELEDRLSFQAFHDALTGMANRQLFGDRLE
ncbi:MAG TPA: PAS domain S-box protein, partial [Jatrophihabitans sp.]|nr:PAS domain S-box protein [Jatrophihabitans sp.]